MVDEPVPHLRVVPSSPDGRLSPSVVLVEEFLVLLSLQVGGLGRADSGVSWVWIFMCRQNLHDALRHKPVSHVTVLPSAVSSVLGLPVVLLHQLEELLPLGWLGVDDTVLDEPLVDGRGGPGVVDGLGGFQVSCSDIVQ